jgi:hypothetical protein
MLTGVTKSHCTKSKAPAEYAHIIGILERLIHHLGSYFIAGCSGTAVGSKGLIDRIYLIFFKIETKLILIIMFFWKTYN